MFIREEKRGDGETAANGRVGLLFPSSTEPLRSPEGLLNLCMSVQHKFNLSTALGSKMSFKVHVVIKTVLK